MFIFSIIALFILIPLCVAGLSLAPWVPTRTADLERVNKLANLKPHQVFTELGCGDARVSYYISKNNPQVHIKAFELAYPLFFIAKLKNLFYKQKNIKIYLKNLFHQDLSNTDVIYVFGMRDSLEKEIRKKLDKELKTGSKVISYFFQIKGWEDIEECFKPTSEVAPIYVYQK